MYSYLTSAPDLCLDFILTPRILPALNNNHCLVQAQSQLPAPNASSSTVLDNISGLPSTSLLDRASNVYVGLKSGNKSTRTSCIKRHSGTLVWHQNIGPLDLVGFSLIQFEICYKLPWLKTGHVLARSEEYRLDDLIQMQGSLDRDSSICLHLKLASTPAGSEPPPEAIILMLSVREISSIETVREATAFAKRHQLSLRGRSEGHLASLLDPVGKCSSVLQTVCSGPTMVQSSG
ncbi:uncharacterized protein ARMOST_01499 [Armillaria ostoyae]|uniref:C2 domain-containing protein n=1 Tax=Armillaria ostoyae TaxID=47428 RepID=A0A284QP68_ARMOS|nr:uncharacterized protein ARMOST_01499 [Armillaria ostoyae]